MTENEISYKIIGVAIDMHKNTGPGLLESVYEHALAYDLTQATGPDAVHIQRCKTRSWVSN